MQIRPLHRTGNRGPMRQMERVDRRRQQDRYKAAESGLLARFRNGDESAFQALVKPSLPGLMALARRHCHDPHWAEDLVQETLVRALRGLAGFRGESSLRTWLFRILVRLASEPARWRRQDPAQQTGHLEVPDSLESMPLHDAM
ncbi:MAG: hypothetical protein KDC98_07635, partial [Planctomycetes bacterium]|nr:hypothetical protein [Planctomycetota bacterium]